MKGKHISGLDCAAPADEMIRLALHAQLKAMCSLRGQALNWNDPEGVHDMRVLSRRLRSAISDFKPYLRKPDLPTTRLRRIAKSLGGVRDEDVALAALTELKTHTEGDAAAGIETLAEERRARRSVARAALEEAISSKAIKEFRVELEERLKAITMMRPRKIAGQSAEDVALTFDRVGMKAIAERLEEFRSATHYIFDPFDIKRIHELRILAKRLRYAIELCEVCWGEDARTIAKEIAMLQTSLGELHDCDVWIEDLGERLKKMANKDHDNPQNAQANAGYTWLLKHFSRERMEHYRDALGRWQQWEAVGFLNGLETVVKSRT